MIRPNTHSNRLKAEGNSPRIKVPQDLSAAREERVDHGAAVLAVGQTRQEQVSQTPRRMTPTAVAAVRPGPRRGVRQRREGERKARRGGTGGMEAAAGEP